MATYTVYAYQVEDVCKRLDRLAKKAAAYSVPFSYEVGEEHPETVRVYAEDPAQPGVQFVRETYTVAAVDIDVDCDELIKANGWTVRATIEHGENGNIVTGFGKGEIMREWYKAPARCDHCGMNRFRSVTFICEGESGELRQVGRTCLHDYTGISPATAAMWAEVRDIFSSGMDCMEGEWEQRSGARMYGTLSVLAHACDSIKEFGYRKSDALISTRDEVTKRVLRYEEPSAEGLEKAKLICDWLIERGEKAESDDAELKELWNMYRSDGDERYCSRFREINNSWDAVSDLERNCIPPVKSEYASRKHFGRLSYMPVAYDRFMERKAKAEQREAERASSAAASGYVGEIGKRLTITAESAALVTSWEGCYGVTFLYRFTDAAGNVFIWRASRQIDVTNGMKLRGTVKDHSEYQGIKQTVLTRCTAA